jgi:hypothetical protein
VPPRRWGPPALLVRRRRPGRTRGVGWDGEGLRAAPAAGAGSTPRPCGEPLALLAFAPSAREGDGRNFWRRALGAAPKGRARRRACGAEAAPRGRSGWSAWGEASLRPPPPQDFAAQRSGLAAGDVGKGSCFLKPCLEALGSPEKPGLRCGGCEKAKAIHSNCSLPATLADGRNATTDSCRGA